MNKDIRCEARSARSNVMKARRFAGLAAVQLEIARRTRDPQNPEFNCLAHALARTVNAFADLTLC